MLSTTERERGQVLVLFVGGLVTVLILAALAFDAGVMILERRDQQNAADAAALAGARYLPAQAGAARAAATSVAQENGFSDGDGTETVVVTIPAASGEYQGLPGTVEVRISSTRPSVFAGIMGIAGWPVGARAVAINQDGVVSGYSILALEPEDCKAMQVTGQGDVLAYGDIQVNSTCATGAMNVGGQGNIAVKIPGGACNVVGPPPDGLDVDGGGSFTCVENEGAKAIPDPLAGLPVPAQPGLPKAAVQVSGALEDVPDGCPGSEPDQATADDPVGCQFPSKYKNTAWRLFPGLYPGGIKLQGGKFYLEPGIYYLGGGGLEITGNDTMTVSVAAGGTSGPAGGVMFYNTGIPGSPIGPISLNGASADINLYPLADGSRWSGLVIFQDRDANINGDDVTINGSDSDMNLRGTIYVASGDVKVNGNTGTMIMDQVIALTYLVNGGGGTIQALNDEDFVVKFTAAGLVE